MKPFYSFRATKRYPPYWASAQRRHLPFLAQFILDES